MHANKYKYIYGPVPSWRLGASLGIDPVSKGRKICSFDCVYCQVGKTGFFTDRRDKFIESREIIEELKSLPPIKIDYITFSGAGEPTLAVNLGEMIKEVRKIRDEQIAVITNSSLFDHPSVWDDLLLTDFVIAKLDAPSGDIFQQVNQPLPGIQFERIVSGLKTFRRMYTKKLAIQVMFIKRNKAFAREIAQIVKEINPDEVQINTPLRPCKVKPLSREELNGLESYFDGLHTVSVYDARKPDVRAISDEDTLKRRGKTK